MAGPGIHQPRPGQVPFDFLRVCPPSIHSEAGAVAMARHRVLRPRQPFVPGPAHGDTALLGGARRVCRRTPGPPLGGCAKLRLHFRVGCPRGHCRGDAHRPAVRKIPHCKLGLGPAQRFAGKAGLREFFPPRDCHRTGTGVLRGQLRGRHLPDYMAAAPRLRGAVHLSGAGSGTRVAAADQPEGRGGGPQPGPFSVGCIHFRYHCRRRVPALWPGHPWYSC